jgi:ABC-type proline/glycine betaine transport system ATPase subunit
VSSVNVIEGFGIECDAHTKEVFQHNLKRIHKKLKTTTIHITHDFNEAVYLADRIAIMKDGEVCEIGTSEEIFKNPKSEFVANFTGYCKSGVY